MARKTRLALVGLGGWGQVAARALRQVKHTELAAAYSVDRAEGERFAQKFGSELKASYQNILRDPSIDGILIITPNHTHRELCVLAAKAGKHVFVDKPMANTLKDAFAIYHACRDAGVLLAVGHNSRRAWCVRQMKKRIDSGDLGQVSMTEATFAHGGGLELTPKSWRWYKKSCPACPLMQLGVHHIDSLQYLFGPIASVQAVMDKLVIKAEVEDVALLLVRFASGLMGYIGSGYAVKPSNKTISVYGTSGSLYLRNREPRGNNLEVHRQLPDKTRRIRTFPAPAHQEDGGAATRLELDEFSRAIQGKAKIEVTGHEGITALAVVEAAILAARSGKTVDVRQLIRKYDRKFKL
jgi:predicted dehydrogenase